MIDSNKSIKSVVVFGGAGYLGSVMSERLIQEGYRVTIYDELNFGREPISNLLDSEQCQLIVGDIRDSKSVGQAVKNHDAVILLAALVGDPACASDPDETISVNVLGSTNVLEACRQYGTQRFIFASTDSCYGTQTGIINELNPLIPVSLYGEAKMTMEDRIMTAWQEDRIKTSPQTGTLPGFAPVILRMATLYGLSPRMRFDLVLNLLTWRACNGQTIMIYGGEQWRPLVHVRDAAEAYLYALRAPAELVSGQIFNVGANDQNIQIKDLGQTVATVLPHADTEWVDQPPDLRDYHVDFSKVTRVLGWEAQRSMQDGIEEIRDAAANGKFDKNAMHLYRNA